MEKLTCDKCHKRDLKVIILRRGWENFWLRQSGKASWKIRYLSYVVKEWRGLWPLEMWTKAIASRWNSVSAEEGCASLSGVKVHLARALGRKGKGPDVRGSCMPAKVFNFYLVGVEELLVFSGLGSSMIRSVCFADESGSSVLVGLET